MVLGPQPLARLSVDEIEIAPHDPGWPALYEAERAWLVPMLAPFGLIELAHVGSTAVPGLAAKPIIDIAARIASLAIARERAIVPLAEQVTASGLPIPIPMSCSSPRACRPTRRAALTICM